MPSFLGLWIIIVISLWTVSCKRQRPADGDVSSLQFGASEDDASSRNRAGAGINSVRVAGRVLLQGQSIVFDEGFNDTQGSGKNNSGSRQLFWEKHPKWSYDSLNSTYCQFGKRRIMGEDLEDFQLGRGELFTVATVTHDNALKAISGRALSCGFRIRLDDKGNDQNHLFIECASFNERMCDISNMTAKEKVAEFIAQSVSFEQADKGYEPFPTVPDSQDGSFPGATDE
jgi:hypothetical protein